MTKHEYLEKLNSALKPILKQEREKSLAYYSEVIDERMEDGIAEEAAVSELEDASAAAEAIIADCEARGQMRPHHSPWSIALIVLGFPLWFPLLAALGLVLLSVYLVVWALIGVVFVTSIALALGGVALFFSAFFLISINFYTALASFGVGLACAGLGLALFLPAMFLAKHYALLTASLFRSSVASIKERFGKKA
ncbi:MAG: DUF1700 domain-containing protein [Oscillospiraceae bacterium]